MRVLVGTLYCGENEFDECVESLKAQTHPSWEQFVVADLPNKLAHETLYETFMSRASEFDLFLKLDADMVLEDPTMLERIESYFERHPQLDGITICVHDFFSDTLIHGLHIYRSSVRWPRSEETLFVDAPPVSPEKFRIGIKELRPAASHCKNSSPFFAFHYGVHRGLKARNAGGSSAAYYLQTIEQVWENFQRKQDRRLGLAELGAEMGLEGRFDVGDLDLNNQHSREVCARYQDLPLAELAAEISKLRSQSSIRISTRRWRILKYRVSKSIGSLISGLWPAVVRCVPAGVRRRCAADRCHRFSLDGTRRDSQRHVDGISTNSPDEFFSVTSELCGFGLFIERG